MKKIQLKMLLILMLLITLVTTISNASYEDVTMTVVEEPTCTIKFGTNSTVERSVISKNLEEKEITFQLKVTNEETMLKPTGELMLVIDNSNSMTSEISNGVTREDVVIESAKTLITNILQDNEKLKVGIVSFSSDTATGGATAADAKLVSELTNNATDLLSKVSNIQYDGPLTNLDSAITLAPNYFSSEDNNKYIVVLTDGVPNIAIDNNKYFSEAVIEKTKTSLSALKNVADNVIIMLTGITEGDSIPGGSQAANKLTYNQIIQEVFGTEQSPKEGIDKFYYVTDSEVEKTITEDIYKDLLPISQSFSDIIVKDYFSK